MIACALSDVAFWKLVLYGVAATLMSVIVWHIIDK